MKGIEQGWSRHSVALRNAMIGATVLAHSRMALAGGGSLQEADNVVTWVLGIFSPGLLLALLTIVLVVSGLAVWMGRMSGGLALKVLIGSILVFGARAIAPRIAALF